MFKPRKTAFYCRRSFNDWDFKLYRIQADENATNVDWDKYETGLDELVPGILSRPVFQTSSSPRVGFVICHEGSSMGYLVLCLWGNDNELFTEVRVWLDDEWKASKDYSFCLFDMEVMWFERNAYVKTLYPEVVSREEYLNLHFSS